MRLVTARLAEEFLVHLIDAGVLMRAAVLGFFIVIVNPLCTFEANFVSRTIRLTAAGYAAAQHSV